MQDVKYYLSVLNSEFEKQEDWFGCFGVASVISLQLVKYLERKYNIWYKWCLMTHTKKDRCVLERAFAIVMFAEGLLNQDCSLFGCKHDFEDNSLEYILSHPEQYEKYPVLKVCYGR